MILNYYSSIGRQRKEEEKTYIHIALEFQVAAALCDINVLPHNYNVCAYIRIAYPSKTHR